MHPERGEAVGNRGTGAVAGGDCDHDDRERDQRERDEDAGHPSGPRDTAQIGAGQHDDSREGDEALRPQRPGPRVGRERQCHRGARRCLADHESPAGEKPPPFPEPLAAVDVRAPRSRILGGELCRGNRVAVRDARGEREPDQEAAPRRPCRRPEGREDAGTDHRAEPDDDRVSRAEPADERRGRRHIAAATRSAAAASSSSGTFGRTSSQSGSIIPAASTMPSGRGMNQTWKCAPPSPQR